MRTIALISLGCAKNLVDSEVMLGYLAHQRYVFVHQPEEAEIIIVNTCGFIQPAKKEAEDSLGMAVKLKKKGQAEKIIAAGCYVERNKEQLSAHYPEIDAWVGVKDFDKIVSIVEGKPYDQSKSTFLYSHRTPRLLTTPAGWAYIKISEGCSHLCSFCAIPSIKGAYQSRPILSIVQEAKKLVSQGVKEINLISQDSTHYGYDLGLKHGLVQLLEKLLDLKPSPWIRFLYGYPEEVSDNLLEIMEEEKICSYLDIPFQHSHPEIVRKMKRGMEGRRALKLVEKIRKILPDVAIRTSLIVGFPGEGDKEFKNLEYFVQEARFDHLGVFTYSLEENTGSYLLGDPVESRVKNQRRDRLMAIQAEISLDIMGKYLCRSLDVLVEGHLEQDKTVLIGRGQFQAPEVDGVVFIDTEGKDEVRINSVQEVEITDRDIYDLYGVFKA
ncbi:MAG: 30S ribosomal protein S12 methylthiotransferase RimO [Candidatus Aminicenantes bacterium]|jgi:ribosomal protein S12 methylthiotransferase